MSQSRLARDDVLETVRLWWVIVVVGLASVAAGVILVARPSNSLKTLAVVVGIFLLLDGIAELISSLGRGREHRAMAAIVGVVGIVIGIVLIRHPTSAVSAIGLIIGIWLVVAGAGRLIGSFVSGGPVLLGLLLGLLELAVGIAVIADPHIGYATLAVLVGICLIINGIGTTALGFAIRGAGEHVGTPTPAAS